MKVAVLILTHNAPQYVRETLLTLNTITNSADRALMEIIVVDNDSDNETKKVLINLKSKDFINKLYFSDINTFFAGGNNIAAKMASDDCDFYLLLNSDISVRNKDWLAYLLNCAVNKHYAVVSFGACSNPTRADGFCMLIDKKLYDKYQLDENFQWFWSVTKIQSQILRDGYNILAIKNHNKYLIHYGGKSKSGLDLKQLKGMDIIHNDILNWFKKVLVEEFALLKTCFQ